MAGTETPIVADVTVASTASLMIASSSLNERSLAIQALAANTETIYVGPIGVTTSTGFPLVAGATFRATGRDSRAAYYGIVASVSQHVRVLSVSQ